MSSYNEDESLIAVFEENNENAWLYLCVSTDENNESSEILADVFVCNTVELIEHTDLEKYKPNLPPITKGFGHPEAVCLDIGEVFWELNWLGDKTILLTKDQKPWALISHEDNRGMCKAIKKTGPWGKNWNEKKYKKFC